ncbi:MAG: glycosyltransferase family 39 protein [Planctomycetes bacterium]|nr:glycosyltransferase family 39 protein [Planctomycetota bacterium]
MRDGSDAPRVRPAVIVALAAITAAGLWLRLRATPGPWGSDALLYAERAVGGGEGAADTRSQRMVFVELVRLGLGLGGGTPAAASFAGIAISALVGPVLWMAARNRLGDALALLPAALWAILGLDIEEVVEISADAATALPGALIALTLVVARARPEAAKRWIFAGGLAAGAGVLLKETGAFAAVGLGVGALVIGRGRERWTLGAIAAGGAVVVLALATVFGVLQRPEVASQEMLTASAPVHWNAPGFVQRITIDVPRMLLTATGAFGLLHVAALPLLARLPFRAARGDAVAAAALAGVIAFDIAPISFSTWAVLPANFPRYLLPVIPVWLLAISETLGDAAPGPIERRVSLLAAAAGLMFIGRSPMTWFVVPVGLALTAWPCLTPTSVSGQVRQTTAFVLAAAGASALLTPWARVAPDATWNAWSLLPRDGAVHADRLVGRRLAFAARTAPGADASRVRLIDDEPRVPPEVAPGDVVLVRRGTKLALACALDAGFRELDIDLGETLPLIRR